MNEIIELIITFAFSIVLIFGIGYSRCNYGMNDILTTKLHICDLNGWSLMHFGLFTYIGYRFPSRIIEAMVAGILWELWEHWCGETRPRWMGKFGDCILTTDHEDIPQEKWWYGRYSDLIMNLSGFMVGQSIKTRI